VAVPKTVTVFDVVPSPTAPVTHLAVVCAPGMYGTVANGDLSFVSSLAFEVGGLVHVAINAMAYTGNSVGSSKVFRATVHGKSFSL